MKCTVLFLVFSFFTIDLFAQQDSTSITVSNVDSVVTNVDSFQVGLKDTTVYSAPIVIEIEEAEVTPFSIEEEDAIKPSGFAVPVALMIQGLWIKGNNGLYSSQKVREDMNYHFPDFYTPIDDYIQYIPTIAGYATGFIPGTTPRHANGRRLWMLIQSQVLMSLSTLALKHYTHELRPDGSDYHSFPSGHTAQAFMGAAFFDMEYPKQMRGVKIGLYSLAGLTGALAMMNDRHWAGDVLFGAGLGMLSVRMVFWSEQYFNRKKTLPRKYD